MSQLPRSNSSAFEPFRRTSSSTVFTDMQQQKQQQEQSAINTVNARKNRKNAFNNIREMFKCKGTTAKRVLPCLRSQSDEPSTTDNTP